MTNEWTQARIQQLIDDGTQESLTLEYKAADALSKSDDKKKNEVTKDVAAMANSAGGIIIYGVKEYDDSSKRHLPEKLDPIDMTKCSKEWLEQVIMNIQPRISNLIIHPVTIDTMPNGVAYVVEIPQSTTAHQSRDHRYYKRFNFESVPMEDYEIRDVMGRSQHPKIELQFEIHAIHDGVFFLKTYASNVGSVYAQYVVAKIDVPYDLFPPQPDRNTGKFKERIFNLDERYSYTEKNYGDVEGAAPILPSTSLKFSDKRLIKLFEEFNWENREIIWVVLCDNAPPNKGRIAITNIPFIDHRAEGDDDDE